MNDLSALLARPVGDAELSRVKRVLPGGWRIERGTQNMYLHNPGLFLAMRPITKEAWRQLKRRADLDHSELLELFERQPGQPR